MDSCQKRIGRGTEMPRDEQQSQEPKPGPNVWDTHKIDPPFIATIENNTSNMPTRQNSFFPEGGFGWLVVVAATWCNGSIFAIQNSFSILHVMLVNANQQTHESVSQFQIAWIGALSLGMVFLCSPLVCISTDRFGCRATAVGGSLVAFVGLLTGSFAKSLPLQYLTYGLLFGAGCSFSLQPTLVILGQYFQRRLGLASGLVTAGSSLFSMALPVLLEEVLVPLGLERTFQILSVLPVTQAVLIGATFRPPPNHERHIDAQSNTSQMECGNQHSHNDRRECGKSGRHRWGNDSTLHHHDDYALSSQEQPPQGTIGNLQKHSTGQPTKSFPNSTSTATINNQATEYPTTSLPNSNSMATMSNQVLSHHWRSDEENKCSGLRIFVTVPSYGLWAFGVAIAVLGYFVPYVHLMSFMEEQFEDSEKKQWILLVCIGASSGVGRLVFGRVGDLLPGLSKIYLQAVSFMFLGLASILLPQCLVFEGLAAVCVLLGACDGCLITLMAPVAFQVLGVRQASQGIGYLLGLMALPMTAGPPLAGLLHDQMGNYHLAFYLAGVPPLLGGLLLLLIPRMHHRLWAFQAEMPLGPPRTTMAHAGESLPSQNIFTNGEPNLNERETTEL